MGGPVTFSTSPLYAPLRTLLLGEPLLRMQESLLRLLGYLDRNRNGEEEEKLQQGELPFSVTMLIYDLRRPTIM